MKDQHSSGGAVCLAAEPPVGTWRLSFCIGEVALALIGDSSPPRVLGSQFDLFSVEEPACDIEIALQWVDALTVSYTHLTLPTIYSV